ncbi:MULTISPECIES: ATP-binding protein [unclassified Oceanispirochaeta]|uniref:ATP-binding protein n=1 Tax=unclassified Oceanispirochaeta TaxID=2635722 RepID=UPI000E09541D|nr:MULTISPECIES: ATP-binding protein [unclassified Oceanispirochaeta]MBF9018204.1 ATP-binding protein [Oceanispirochaeta sp. M2]NPD74690.1 4Fe-4S binding protein [Oceanispirochaeta sp. M1]RDG29482.1 (4Fe-4S)-binding protein [Oceanispirochaeta sp. M1]
MNKIKETVIISGKGGTGKTSVTASLIPFMKDTVFADCDVDAPNLSILLEPERKKEELFYGMKRAVFNQDLCSSCGQCLEYCRFGAIRDDFSVITPSCEGCAVCVHVCPTGAMTMKDVPVGSLFESETPYGTMVHARLIPGEETSGRLVSQVRKNAMTVAEETGKSRILIDGPPGIGCSVISSVTGADSVCIVTEPTLSGLHDLKRVYTMILRFNPEVFIIINKSDLSEKVCSDIEAFAAENDIPVTLKIPFRKEIIEALSDKQIPSLAEKEFFRDLGWEDLIKKLNPSEIQ